MFAISGPGGAARKLFPIDAGPPHGEWDAFSVPIIQSEWEVTAGTWTDLLRDVTLVRIDMERISVVEVTGLDNVFLTLIPEPSTAPLLGFGLVWLTVGRRRHTP
jgi:hypothetical protein